MWKFKFALTDPLAWLYADLLLMLRRRDKIKAHAFIRRIARGFEDYDPSCKLYRDVLRDFLPPSPANDRAHLRTCAERRIVR